MNAENSLETMKDMGTKTMDKLTELAELNMKTLGKMADGHKKVVDFMMEQTKEQMQLASEVKGFDELVRKQGELAKKTSERLLEESKEGMKVASEVREDYRNFVQEGMNLLSDKVRKTTNM